jgi:hypothetical protein
MARGIIYLITNKENGYKFVGQSTQTMNKVWQAHIQAANRMSNDPLYRAFRQFGLHKFNIREIDECDERLLNEKEEYWKNHYNTYTYGEGYNFIEYEEEEEEEEIIQKEIPPKYSGQEAFRTIEEEQRGNGKHSGLRIQGTNVETGEIKEWDTIRDAAEEVAGNRNRNSNLLYCARNGYNCYGYKWKVLEEKNKKKSIFGIHKSTGHIGPHFESIAEACRELGGGSKGTGLFKSLRNPGRFSWRGLYWYYK